MGELVDGPSCKPCYLHGHLHLADLVSFWLSLQRLAQGSDLGGEFFQLRVDCLEGVGDGVHGNGQDDSVQQVSLIVPALSAVDR